jgi:outer membrane receptor protein involved in Fe transport
MELGINVKFSEWLMLYGNYTYVKAEAAGKTIPAVPSNKINLGLGVKNIVDGLFFSAHYTYTGSRFAISDQSNAFGEVESHYSIDSKISYEWKMFRAFLGVNNLTNEKYSEYEVMDTFQTTRNFYPSPERRWTAGLEIGF